ncbi:MAG: adenylosuccinate lyase [Coriobacteriales bacterium]|nr:adenylosuccinate lyase [Coriobacteriales bacterium]
MIDRYSTDQISEIFSLQNQFDIWLDVELLALEAHYKYGDIDIKKKELDAICKYASFSLKEIAIEENKCHHDLIAFLKVVSKYIDKGSKSFKLSPSRWLHYGLTSNDVKDTGLSIQIVRAIDCVKNDTKKLQTICLKKAKQYKDTLCVGRTHGIYAEPYIFGLKFANWFFALERCIERLDFARQQIAVGSISGAVGSYSSLDPRIEAYVCKKLKLGVDPVSTQVIARDRHAQVLATLATCSATLENIATQIRLMQQSDCLEIEEPFAKGQKGSSAMPHKRNPIVCERICGLSRVVRANAQVGFDSVTLWYERDISHSSCERTALVDSFQAYDYCLQKLTSVLSGIKVYKEKMIHNLNRSRGLIYSSKAINVLIDAGLGRQIAYDIVQENAMKVWNEIQKGKEGTCLLEKLVSDPRCTVDKTQLQKAFDYQQFLQSVDKIFSRLK